MKILYGEDARVIAWMRNVLPVDRNAETALGVVRDDGTLIAGFACVRFLERNAKPVSMEICVVATRPIWARPEIMRDLLFYPFVQVGCVRLTSMVAASNRLARKTNEKAGFVQEGVIRKGFDGTDDLIVYGMLRNECRWLPKDVP